MPTFRIVTDSCAHFTNPYFAQQQGITVVPNKISIAGKTYREGVDLSAEEAMRLIVHEPYAPLVTSPSEAEYLETFRRLAPTADGIISIHGSREMFSGWSNAMAAAHQIAGECEVAVIDSRTLDAAQGILVKVATQAITQPGTLEDIVRVVRGAVERIYAAYYVESMNYLLQNKIMKPSHAILGAMLNIKPVLAIEEGRILPMEKVRTRGQAVDRLVEFVTEFADIEEIVLLQHKSYLTEQTRMIQDRLSVEFADQYFPYSYYGPTMASLIGADATGVIILERETEEFDDDF
ncbi:MAG: DegV family protein [Anaerolineae bacterium]|nr:DegV family protein [Anaerolineae bacterium]